MAVSFNETKQRTGTTLKVFKRLLVLNKKYFFFKTNYRRPENATIIHICTYNRRTLLEVSSTKNKFKKMHRAHILAGNKSPVPSDVAIQNLWRFREDSTGKTTKTKEKRKGEIPRDPRGRCDNFITT